MRLFVLCGSVAIFGAAVATFAFYSYRTALTNDRLAAELTAQAHAIAPLASARLEIGDGGQHHLFADRRQIRHSGKMPLGR